MGAQRTRCHLASWRSACLIAPSIVGGMTAQTGDNSTKWIIHEERVLDDTRKARFSIAQVELPDGVHFEQYVLRLPKAAVVVVLNDHDEVLMMRRHRWIIDRWVWEMPGGYVNDHEQDAAVSAAREVEEETGWRPRTMKFLCSFQPMVGTADAENLLYLARGADDTGAAPDVNEAQEIRWIPLDEAVELISRGEIVGAASVVGITQAKMIRDAERLAQAATTS